jgi:uncharacterized protein YbjT (DUF2867 family)
MTGNILVSGGTGRVGATGRYVIQELIEQGWSVRALVHTNNERAQHLAQLGAEVVVGDLLDIHTVRSALRGIQRAYFCYPIADHLLEAATTFAVSAKEAGLEAVVEMSQITAIAGDESPAGRQHWLTERVFDWAGVGAIHVRPTFFAENLLFFTGRAIVEEGKMYLPYGAGRSAPVAAEDIGHVIRALLINPAPHLGKTYPITGPEALTMQEQAAVFSKVLEKQVTYVDIPLTTWKTILAEKLGLSSHLVEHLAVVARRHVQGDFDQVSNVVRTIGGSEPTFLEAFIRAHAQKLPHMRA